MKKYKECSPEITIDNIKNILDQNNINVKITKTDNGFFYSCQVDICNNKLKKLGFRSYGKGMTEKYSLASGFAELMESIQNKKIFSNFDNGSACFRERLKKYEEIYKDNTCDFYSVMEHCVTNLSYEQCVQKTGGSGMCAGNSAKEAITQGICEIFERYVIREIYKKNLSLPTIPLDFFKGSELHKRVSGLLKQNQNLKVVIKDCSLNCGLPVVGVIIIDTENQLYNFNLGSDCNPIVATERCFTELFQNTKNFIGISYEFTKSLSEIDFLKTVDNGTGSWPISIFKEESTFSFTPNSLFYSNVIENDLEYCVNVIRKMGYNIYVRDNSFLGFPAYYVFVPEMSVLKRFLPQGNLIDFFKFSELCVLSENELKEFADNLDNYYITIKNEDNLIGINKYFPYNSDIDLQDIDLNLFLALLMYRVYRYDRYIFYMDQYLKDKSKEEYGYYYAAYNFVILYQIQKQKLESVTSILSKCYGEKLAEEIISDMISPKDAFNYYKFPSYPDCSKCKLRKDCRVDDVVQICVDLRKKEIAANIDQGKLAEVFDFEI